jgi:Flp pilus assembly protein CpaB
MERVIEMWRTLGLGKLKLTAIVPILVGIVVCAEAASLLSAKTRRIEEPRYLVARRELPAGQPVTSIDFTLADAGGLGGEVPPGALTDQELHHLKGAATRTPLKAGQCLTRDDVRWPDPPEPLAKAVPRGLRAYSLDGDPGLEIRAGDRVDVVLNPSDEKSPPFPLVEAALVLRIGRQGDLVVAVSSPQIQLLEKAKRQGKLTVVLRNPSDDSPLQSGIGARRARGPRPQKGRHSIEVLSEGE